MSLKTRPISSKLMEHHVNEFLETDRMDNNLLLVFKCKCLIWRNFFASKWLLALNIQQNLNGMDVKWLDLPVKGLPLNSLPGVCQKTHPLSFLYPFCPIWKNQLILLSDLQIKQLCNECSTWLNIALISWLCQGLPLWN